jgi:hypothetical protein
VGLRTGLKFAFLWTVYADFGMEFSHDETEVAKWEGYPTQVEKMGYQKQRIKNRLEDIMTPGPRVLKWREICRYQRPVGLHVTGRTWTSRYFGETREAQEDSEGVLYPLGRFLNRIDVVLVHVRLMYSYKGTHVAV